MSSLYEQLGGAAAVEAAVDLFYRKVLADGQINHFFQGVDLKHLARHQKAFLAMAFGGPARFRGRALRHAHADLVSRGLNDSHFDVVVQLLGQTLAELGVPQPAILQAASVAESVRDDVLGRDARAA